MVTRREFFKKVALGSAALAASGVEAKTSSLGFNKIHSPFRSKDKVKLACIGIGHRGEQIMNDLENTGLANIVALCDVDMGAPHTQKMMEKYPKAKRFQDFRKLFEEYGDQFEAVSVATPDHSHFPICMLAMDYGKHVYVEKPMGRTFYEAELMMDKARRHPNVVTQVGNQGHSEANYFQFKAWLEAGIIKDVTAVSAHMNNPRRWHTWDPNIYKLPAAESIPETLDWDTWMCAVPYHEYNKLYHYGEWRSWFDLGMGALGDWGAHILDTVHEFLELGLPYEINPIFLDQPNDYFYPMSSTILFKFPQRKGMPPVDVTWYDGVDNLPPIPDGYGVSALDPNIPASGAGEIKPSKLNPGKIIYSKELTFKGGSHGSTLEIIPKEKAIEMESLLPNVPESSSNHFANFLLSCQGIEKPRSPFEIHGPLSQVFSLGVMAQRLRTPLYFDSRTKEITNNAFANAMLAGLPPRKGWEEFYQL
ncbi:MAG: Gfo/Idh/MocA family oxidoreductase [Bacteroides sp.]|nr:Gfo/Idh/MocA family oxidoreductase [Bacteroides sp.]MDD2645930.1 Gfo/Idh/MocA family oxidoreductase [Bacteroides sp.]MDD4054788.1 Gfo/Idh/MocA family oxidoreductase [Bacteroides sp.]MDD4719417.1 Gfo/Idh/MocA family oxidoreductase [Bacteroides sp.]NLI64920.1 Gfo/Idh/MocA family oxidoreductase [Bacteroidales bacterium]